MSVHHMHAWACGGQKKALDPLKLELWSAVSHHVGARKTKSQGLFRSSDTELTQSPRHRVVLQRLFPEPFPHLKTKTAVAPISIQSHPPCSGCIASDYLLCTATLFSWHAVWYPLASVSGCLLPCFKFILPYNLLSLNFIINIHWYSPVWKEFKNWLFIYLFIYFLLAWIFFSSPFFVSVHTLTPTALHTCGGLWIELRLLGFKHLCLLDHVASPETKYFDINN